MKQIPEIVFDINQKWKEGNVLDYADVKQGYPFNSKDYVKSGNYNIITIGNVGGDRFIRNLTETNKIAGLPEGIQSHHILKNNQILISMTGNVGRVSLNKGDNNLLNQRVDVLISKPNIDQEFLFQRLSNSDFESKMTLNGQGAAQLNISNSDIENYIISVPDLIEQKRVGILLLNIDLLLDGRINELDKLRKFKFTMLKKMFPGKNSRVPEIRFNGFVNDWDIIDFGSVFIKLGNNTLSRDLLNYRDGNIKNIHYGDILINFGSSIDVSNNIVPFINQNVDISNFKQDYYLKSGDVVFADTAEDTIAGKMVEIINDLDMPVLSGLHTYACRPSIKFEKGFLGILMNTDNFHNQLIPYMQGTKVTGFNYDYLCKTKVIYPNDAEQRRITQLFNNIDDLILSQEKEIDTYKHLKITLLEKMYV